jgi:large conductance mechanosensitive channel
MRKLGAEFRAFLFRGNIIDLAVAVVLGTAFAALVKAFVDDLLTPIIALIFGKPNFSTLSFTINSSHFLYGDFINALITFLSIAVAIFFFVVKPSSVLAARRARGELEPESDTRPCTECLSEIPRAARRCAFCTADQTPITV